MTKKQIKNALRNEAKKPYPLFVLLPFDAFNACQNAYRWKDFRVWGDNYELKRTFMLLVAEALE